MRGDFHRMTDPETGDVCEVREVEPGLYRITLNDAPCEVSTLGMQQIAYCLLAKIENISNRLNN
ncbi:MAG: hypothetical protein ACJ73N_14190 [Bryobacteraceae bacterium]